MTNVLSKTTLSLSLVVTGIQAQGQTAVYSEFCVAAAADANYYDTRPQSREEFFLTRAGADVIDPFSHRVSTTNYGMTGGSLTVQSGIEAVWTSPGSGTIRIREIGWQYNTVASSSVAMNGHTSVHDMMTYTFISNVSGKIEFDYNVWTTGNSFGVLGFDIGWSAGDGLIALMDPYYPTKIGSAWREIHAGETYTFSIINRGNNTTVSPQTGPGYLNGDFGWRLVFEDDVETMVSGTVLLSDWVGSRAGTDVLVEFLNAQNAVVDSQQTTLSPTGAFLVHTIRTGMTKIRLSSRHFLRKTVGTFNLDGADILNCNALLTNGDADGSGEVDAVDIDRVIETFGSSDVWGDLDGSREVDAVDIDLAIANFGATDN